MSLSIKCNLRQAGAGESFRLNSLYAKVRRIYKSFIRIFTQVTHEPHNNRQHMAMNHEAALQDATARTFLTDNVKQKAFRCLIPLDVYDSRPMQFEKLNYFN